MSTLLNIKNSMLKIIFILIAVDRMSLKKSKTIKFIKGLKTNDNYIINHEKRFVNILRRNISFSDLKT